ncbi:MAG: hypothetical protein FK730_01900, partial [Asgard group archaeon]|nr:hypothetical protein [Asgard group archaeon]
FDIVWVPAGPHWTYLVPNPTVHNILSMAHEEGLVVGSICIGTLILAHANGIVDGVKVVYYSGSFEKMTEENAIIVHNTNVVSDKKIVTAGTGQYQTTNYAIYPFCVAMTKAVLGHSTVISTTFTSITSETNTNHSITVSTTNLSSIYYGNVSTTITSVKAILNSENVNLHNKIYTLTDDDEDGIFERNFTLTENDNFVIDLEVKSLAWGVESVRSVQTYATASLAPNYLIPIFILSMLITTYLFIRRKKKKNELA